MSECCQGGNLSAECLVCSEPISLSEAESAAILALERENEAT